MKDGEEYSIESDLDIDIHYIPEAPSAIFLTGNLVSENEAIGTSIGEFSTLDPDQHDIFTYSLVDDEHFPSNNYFAIEGNILKTAVEFDYEQTKKCIIKVQTTDGAGLSFEATFEVNILNQYDTSAIVLDNSYLEWNVVPGASVGTLSINQNLQVSSEPLFALVDGDGDTHNQFFEIVSENILKIGADVQLESGTYSVRVQAELQELTVVEVFAIVVHS